MLEIIQLNSIEEIMPLEEEWNNLLKNSETNTIFQTFEFVTSWFKFLGKNRNMMVLTIRENGHLIGIAPVMASKEKVLLFNIKKIEFLGVLNADYCDFIISSGKKEVIEEIYKYLLNNKEWDMIELSKIPETSGTLAVSENIFKKYHTSYDKFTITTSSLIDINTNFMDYFNGRSKKFRKHLKQYIKLLNSNGNLTFEEYKNLELIEPVLKNFFEQRIERWKRKKAVSKFTKEEYKNFYMELTKRMLKKDWLDVSVLKINNKIIASHYGFIYNDRYYYYAPSFDLSYEKYSPGNILLYHLIEEIFNKQIKEFDFGGGIEEYKSKWETKTRSNVQITVMRSLKARLAHMIKKKEYKLRQTGKDSLLYRALKGLSGLRKKKVEG